MFEWVSTASSQDGDTCVPLRTAGTAQLDGTCSTYGADSLALVCFSRRRPLGQLQCQTAWVPAHTCSHSTSLRRHSSPNALSQLGKRLHARAGGFAASLMPLSGCARCCLTIRSVGMLCCMCTCDAACCGCMFLKWRTTVQYGKQSSRSMLSAAFRGVQPCPSQARRAPAIVSSLFGRFPVLQRQYLFLRPPRRFCYYCRTVSVLLGVNAQALSLAAALARNPLPYFVTILGFFRL